MENIKEIKQDHPERLSDEIFIGNYDENGFHNSIGWNSKRIGSIAYDIYGEVIHQNHNKSLKLLGCGLFPAFIKVSEVKSRIEKLSNSVINGDIESVLIFKDMISKRYIEY